MRFPQLASLLSVLREDADTAHAWASPTAKQVERLDAEGVMYADALRTRFDANETVVLARQLLYVKQREINVVYPPTKAKLFIPVSNEIPSGRRSFSVKIWDHTGQAKIVNNYASDDFPTVNCSLTEVEGTIRSIGDSYVYTIQELREAAEIPGLSIDARRARIAREIHDRKIDDLAAIGSSTDGITSFIKNAYIGTTTITGGWATATSDAILTDLHTIANAVNLQSKEAFSADTMLLPTKAFQLIASKMYNALSRDTVLTTFLATNQYVKQVDQWSKLDLANTAGTGGRIVCYKRSPECVELEIPQEFEQFAPELNGLQYKILCHSRCGGVSFHYPISATYAESAAVEGMV